MFHELGVTNKARRQSKVLTHLLREIYINKHLGLDAVSHIIISGYVEARLGPDKGRL